MDRCYHQYLSLMYKFNWIYYRYGWNLTGLYWISEGSVPRQASAATWARARTRGAGLSRTHQHTATFPLKGLRDPEEMAMD